MNVQATSDPAIEKLKKRASTMQVVGLMLWFIVLILFAYFIYRLAFAPRFRHVSVVGEGEAKAPPNEARLTVGVQTETADNVATAADNNAQRLSQVLRAIEAAAPGAEIETLAYNVYPVRDRDNQVTQYQVSNRAKVTLRGAEQVSKASAVLGAVVAAGANQIDGVDFGIDDETRKSLQAQAERSAVQNAYAKAFNLAQAAGNELGVAISIDEPEASAFGDGGAPQFRAMSFEADSVTPPPVRAPDEITVTRRIEVVYQLR